MNYFSVYVENQLSPERLRLSVAIDGAHIRLLCACARRENAGRITGAADYSDRDWLILAGLTLAEIEPVIAAGLAQREGGDLLVAGYDLEGEELLRRKRAGGRSRTGAGRTPGGTFTSTPTSTPGSTPGSTPTSKVRSGPVRSGEEDLCEPGGSRPHASPALIRGKKREARELAKAVVEYLNATASRSYTCTKPTVDLIRARAAGGATLDDFKRVIEHRTAKWASDSKMAEYLRPATLFQAPKFPGYLDEARAATNGAAQRSDTHDFLAGIAAERGEPS